LHKDLEMTPAVSSDPTARRAVDPQLGERIDLSTRQGAGKAGHPWWNRQAESAGKVEITGRGLRLPIPDR